MQAKTPFNPLDVSSYTLAVTSNNGQNQESTNTNTINITNNTKVSLNLSVADSNNYEMTSDNFTNENYYALYTFNVCSQLDSANEYQVFDLSNSNA
ncbi:hypothetical protein J6W20_04720 [bacterium]|nr:hypothetical protein [bacterium]